MECKDCLNCVHSKTKDGDAELHCGKDGSIIPQVEFFKWPKAITCPWFQEGYQMGHI